MNAVTLHIIWGAQAVSRYKMGRFDNIVLMAHAAYDFRSTAEADAFLFGVREARKSDTWALVTNLYEINKLGQPLKSKLFFAVERDDVEALEEILDAGVSPNVRAPNGLTPLQTAALLGKTLAVVTLLSHGAKVGFITDDVQQESALHLTVDYHGEKSKEIADLLIDAEADIDAFNGLHQTPLMKALEKDNLPLAMHLLKNGAKLDYEDDAGQSARTIFARKFTGIVNDPVVDAFAAEIGRVDDNAAEAIARRRTLSHPSPFQSRRQ